MQRPSYQHDHLPRLSCSQAGARSCRGSFASGHQHRAAARCSSGMESAVRGAWVESATIAHAPKTPALPTTPRSSARVANASCLRQAIQESVTHSSHLHRLSLPSRAPPSPRRAVLIQRLTQIFVTTPWISERRDLHADPGSQAQWRSSIEAIALHISDDKLVRWRWAPGPRLRSTNSELAFEPWSQSRYSAISSSEASKHSPSTTRLLSSLTSAYPPRLSSWIERDRDLWIA
jgi:hypothetical protein